MIAEICRLAKVCCPGPLHDHSQRVNLLTADSTTAGSHLLWQLQEVKTL